MNTQRIFAGAVWTNHALQRLSQRGFTQEMAGKTFSSPEFSLPGKQKGTIEYRRRFGKSQVTVIAKKNEKQEWIVLSCWIDPPLPGTEDAKKRKKYREFQYKFKSSGFWGKTWLALKKQFFGY